MSCVLIVEPDGAERLILHRRVEDLGHEVEACETGADALLATSRRIDLVLLAEEPDGPEVCRRLKAMPGFDSVPVVVYSSEPSTQSAHDRAFDAGCEAYLSKPQMRALDRVVGVMLRIKLRNDEVKELNRVLENAGLHLREDGRSRSVPAST